MVATGGRMPQGQAAGGPPFHNDGLSSADVCVCSASAARDRRGRDQDDDAPPGPWAHATQGLGWLSREVVRSV